jgi:hypothetical protein
MPAPEIVSRGTAFVRAWDGSPVRLQGLNVWPGATTSSMVKPLGMNFARIYLNWRDAEPAQGQYNADFLDAVEAQVSWMGSAGIYVLIDYCHQTQWSPYFGQGGDGIPPWYYEDGRFPATSAGRKDAMAAWWESEWDRQVPFRKYTREIVNRFMKYKNVIGYEPMNEPNPGGIGENTAGTQAILVWLSRMRDVIRAVDDERLIFVQTRGGGDVGIKNADFSVFHTMEKVAVDFHWYFNGRGGFNGTGMTEDGEAWDPSWYDTHNQNFTHYDGTLHNQEQNLLIPLRKSRRLNVPLLVGEWGVRTDDVNARVYQDQVFRLFLKYGLSWARWGDGAGSKFHLANDDGTWTPLADQIKDAISRGRA